MRSLPLIVTLLLLVAASADLVRRVAHSPVLGLSMQQPTRSALIAAMGNHKSSFELESIEGDTSVLLVTVTPYVYFLRRWLRGDALGEVVAASNTLTAGVLNGWYSVLQFNQRATSESTFAELTGDATIAIDGRRP